MSKSYIIDEWLWSDLCGENGPDKQKEAFDFIQMLCKKCDKIIVAKGSPFEEKTFNFFEQANNDIFKKKIAKFYKNHIMFNSKKYQKVDISDVEDIPIQGIKPDDMYLIKTYKKIENATIITTDNKLIEILKQNNIDCCDRDNFLKNYLKYLS